MPKFVARLEAQDGSGHYRRSVIMADSKQEARNILEQRETRNAYYRLTTDELSALETKEKKLKEGERLAGKERSQLTLHRQAEPYKLVSLEEEKGA
jgi:type II secretory pathway component PulF